MPTAQGAVVRHDFQDFLRINSFKDQDDPVEWVLS